MGKESVSYSASLAKVHLGEIMEKCRKSGKPVIIRHHKKPYVVILDYRAWQSGQNVVPPPNQLQLDLRALWKSYESSRKKLPRDEKYSSVNLIKELRAERERKLTRRFK